MSKPIIVSAMTTEEWADVVQNPGSIQVTTADIRPEGEAIPRPIEVAAAPDFTGGLCGIVSPGLDVLPLMIGKKLRPKEHIRDWEDSFAEIIAYDERRRQWRIVVDDNFSAWKTAEDIARDFEEFEEPDFVVDEVSSEPD